MAIKARQSAAMSRTTAWRTTRRPSQLPGSRRALRSTMHVASTSSRYPMSHPARPPAGTSERSTTPMRIVVVIRTDVKVERSRR